MAGVARITGEEEHVVPRQVTVADTAAFKQLVDSLCNSRELWPTRQEWEMQQREQQELDRWADQMTAKCLLKLFPDPAEHFAAEGRAEPSLSYTEHATADLLARFPRHLYTVVVATLRRLKFFIPAVRFLQGIEDKKKPRGLACIEFLKEKKFLELESSIGRLKAEWEAEQAARLEHARAAGLLQECQCCYTEDCLEEQMVPCRAGHLYCAACVA
jgi:hypothetical protein